MKNKRDTKKEHKDETQEHKNKRWEHKGGRCMHYVWPSILIITGSLFLLENFSIIDDAFGRLWPLILIVIGICMIGGCCRSQKQ